MLPLLVTEEETRYTPFVVLFSSKERNEKRVAIHLVSGVSVKTNGGKRCRISP
jgi:hypothetical protein